jgi:hypothetical protein
MGERRPGPLLYVTFALAGRLLQYFHTEELQQPPFLQHPESIVKVVETVYAGPPADLRVCPRVAAEFYAL